MVRSEAAKVLLGGVSLPSALAEILPSALGLIPENSMGTEILGFLAGQKSLQLPVASAGLGCWDCFFTGVYRVNPLPLFDVLSLGVQSEREGRSEVLSLGARWEREGKSSRGPLFGERAVGARRYRGRIEEGQHFSLRDFGTFSDSFRRWPYFILCKTGQPYAKICENPSQ